LKKRQKFEGLRDAYKCFNGSGWSQNAPATLSIMTFSILTFSIMTFSIGTSSIIHLVY
jgi:hypothetical protein